MVSYQLVSTVVVENQAHDRDNLVCCRRNISYCHLHILAHHMHQLKDILSLDKLHHRHNFVNSQMVHSMVPNPLHFPRHLEWCDSRADINSLHVDACDAESEAVKREKEAHFRSSVSFYCAIKALSLSSIAAPPSFNDVANEICYFAFHWKLVELYEQWWHKIKTIMMKFFIFVLRFWKTPNWDRGMERINFIDNNFRKNK